MKQFLLPVAFALFSFGMMAQTGSSRLDAITILPQGLCSYTNFTTSGTEMWFRFVAQTEKVAVELQSEKYGNDQAHIHNLKLYRNNETTEMAQDELPFNAEARKLKINLNAGNLIAGETYYLKADRIPRVHECKKEFCHQNGFTNPAQLRLCIQNVSVYIPNDYNGEIPSIIHAFELNRGQLADLDGVVVNEVVMYSTKSSPQVHLGNSFTSFVWAKMDDDTITTDTIHRVDMVLVNAQLNENILKAEETEGHTSYYGGQNAEGILENKSYSRAIRQSAYNKIDVQYYSNEHGLKMYFVVNEGGSHQDIQFKFTGGATTALTATGGLEIKSPIGGLRFEKAIVYYVNPAGNNVIMPQSGRIIDSGTGSYKVEIKETVPPNRKLIIQLEQDGPTRGGDIPWGTYFGGDGTDGIKDVDAGADERFYVTGVASKVNFPIAGSNIYDGTFNGVVDCFLAQFNKEYEREWCTFIGGKYQDVGEGLAHDNSNNVTYVVGFTDSDEITLQPKPFAQNPNCYLDQIGEERNYFISRFNDQGGLEWFSFLLKFKTESIKVRVDNVGNVFCSGSTPAPQNTSPTFSCAALPNGDLPLCRSNPLAYMQDHHSGDEDLFIMKFSPNLDLTWSTYLGGVGVEFIKDIEVDETNIYFLGYTNSQSCTSCYPDNTTNKFAVKSPIAGGYVQETSSGYEGFISRFNLEGELNWSTFYGGIGNDFITDGALHNGQLLVGGISQTNYYHTVEGEPSNNGGFPKKHFATTGFLQDNYGGGGSDNFVAQFRANTALLWSTFIGGSGTENIQGDFGMKVDVNELDQLFVTGRTESGSNNSNGSIDPISNPYFYSNSVHSDYLATGINQIDIFVKGFNPDRTNFWTSYFGANGQQDDLYGEDIAGVQCIKERVYLVGRVHKSESFPLNCPTTVNPYCQADFSYLSGSDGFLAQLKIGADFYNTVEELSDFNKLFKLYPNPNEGIFVIETLEAGSEIKTIEITNQLGQTVKTINKPERNKQNDYEINANELINGIYFVTLTDSKQCFTTKIIKQ